MLDYNQVHELQSFTIQSNHDLILVRASDGPKTVPKYHTTKTTIQFCELQLS